MNLIFSFQTFPIKIIFKWNNFVPDCIFYPSFIQFLYSCNGLTRFMPRLLFYYKLFFNAPLKFPENPFWAVGTGSIVRFSGA